MVGRGGKRRSVAVAFCLMLGLAGCANLPAVGPSREAVVNEAAEPDAPFTYIELSDPILDDLARWPMPSFFGRFGDYRPSLDQRIGIGDSIQVTVWEAAAGGLFSSPVTSLDETGAHSAVIPPQVVARDGSITVPYAGRIPVAGKTPPEVEKIIVQGLTGKAIQPQALVTIATNVSDTVTVTGEVTNGALIPLSTHGYRVLDVIAAAGGVKIPVFDAAIELSRHGRTMQVPMQMLINDPHENIYVRAGDVITVTRYAPSITVAGATGQSAVVSFDSPTMNLEEALAKAGGLLDERSDPNGVFVLRYEPEQLAGEYASTPSALLAKPYVPVVYHVNMRDPASMFLARRFAMNDKDILYVSDSPEVDFRKILILYNLMASPVYQAGNVAAIAVTR
jgi:polysaccharide biosynthesis/export protein